jgi:hypothetical protein
VSLTQDGDLSITMASNAFDTLLTLYDSTGLIALDDDGGSGTDSLITQSLVAGSYTILAESVFEGVTGGYTLTTQFTPLSDPCAGLGGDPDGDGFCSDEDTCPSVPDPGQLDADGDGWGDACDNCTVVMNGDQADADAGSDDNSSLPGTQHYGDRCDADLNNDGTVNTGDFFGFFRPCFGASVAARPECATSDFDGSGTVNTGDFFGFFRPAFGGTPGPGTTGP